MTFPTASPPPLPRLHPPVRDEYEQPLAPLGALAPEQPLPLLRRVWNVAAVRRSLILLVLAVVCGIGWGVVMPLLNALIFDLSRIEARGLNQNLGLLMLQCGFFLGPLSGGWLLPRGGYPLLFGTAAGALLLAAGLVMLVRNQDV